MVGQQPFGGARGSGTNDKAGAALNLVSRPLRFTFSVSMGFCTHHQRIVCSVRYLEVSIKWSQLNKVKSLESLFVAV